MHHDDAAAVSRKIAKTWLTLAEVLALLGSDEHPLAAVRQKFDRCVAECLAEFEDPALRDPLATQIQFVRSLVFQVADQINVTMGPMQVGSIQDTPD